MPPPNFQNLSQIAFDLTNMLRLLQPLVVLGEPRAQQPNLNLYQCAAHRLQLMHDGEIVCAVFDHSRRCFKVAVHTHQPPV